MPQAKQNLMAQLKLCPSRNNSKVFTSAAKGIACSRFTPAAKATGWVGCFMARINPSPSRNNSKVFTSAAKAG